MFQVSWKRPPPGLPVIRQPPKNDNSSVSRAGV
jgi:hypothetical protein